MPAHHKNVIKIGEVLRGCEWGNFGKFSTFQKFKQKELCFFFHIKIIIGH